MNNKLEEKINLLINSQNKNGRLKRGMLQKRDSSFMGL